MKALHSNSSVLAIVTFMFQGWFGHSDVFLAATLL